MIVATPSAVDTSAQGAGDGILFRADGLQKRFGGVQAVLDISLSIPAGIVFAVIGPNGAGKSTLLNLMSGLYQPDAGKIAFSGVDLVGMPSYQRARYGLARTFQKIRLFKQLSVLENVIAGFSYPPRNPSVAVCRARRRVSPRSDVLS